MNKLAYFLVDVFTSQPFGGNPLAVFPDAASLPDAAMQAIANELNLSETTFIHPPSNPDSDATVRIFTPRRELPMAGHPTLGTAFVLQNENLCTPKRPGRYVFDEGIGPVSVKIPIAPDPRQPITMHQQPPQFFETLDRANIAACLSLSTDDLHGDLPVQIVSSGVPFIIVPIPSTDALAKASLNYDRFTRTNPEARSHEFLLYSPTSQSDRIQCRMFAPRFGILEDPATGSGQGPIAGYRHRYEGWSGSPCTTLQGLASGRPSELQTALETSANGTIQSIKVSGQCIAMGQGSIRRPDAHN